MKENFAYQKKNIIYGYVIYILVSIALTIGLNYYGLKALNGLRAFISGESLYMKAQHEASRNLTNYIFTSKTEHYNLFLENLEVPISDSLARVSMDKNEDDAIATKFLIKGKNLPEDALNIIWVYKNFKNTGKFSEAVAIWREADLLVVELEKFGKEINRELENNPTLNIEKRKDYALRVNEISKLLTYKGNEFDFMVIKNATFFNGIVMLLNAFFALTIITCLIILSLKYINRLTALQKSTLRQNEDLIQTHAEMDLFTHSISHDLRTPISSLQGIISLLEIEDSEVQRNEYLIRMKQILSRQDDFILKIIQFSKNKRTALSNTTIYLPDFFNNIIEDLKYAIDIPIDISAEIEEKSIFVDAFRLDIICRNLISNAIKYVDNKKEDNYIKIKSKLSTNELLISIEDNGIGIEDVHTHKIFDMFYVTSHQKKGSGIGLYLVKEMVSKLNGTVVLKSNYGTGSTFKITIPLVPQDTNV